jgi:hypothetical protein
MHRFRVGLLSLVIGAAAICAGPLTAQTPGTKVPTDVIGGLQGFTQTPAKSFDEFVGRAVLIEFFAYW